MTDSGTTAAGGKGRFLGSHLRRLQVMLVASVLSSLAGIAVAVLLDDASHGGRGGAIGVAIAFYALFASRPTSAEVLDVELTDGLPVLRSADIDLKRGFATTDTILRTMFDANANEKVFLTAASVFSTLVWGFGDLVARLFVSTPACAC